MTTAIDRRAPKLVAPNRPRLCGSVRVSLGVLAFLVLVSPRVYEFVLNPGVSTTGHDFLVYQQGAQSLLHGGSLYDHATSSHLLFTYPPFAAILFVPLVLAPFRVAYALWIAGELAALVWVVHVAFRPLLDRFGGWRPLALGVVAGR
jgi:alpha-1,2-mannosyltransferase